jgi:NADH:quinone reductase (non-electrogenic)
LGQTIGLINEIRSAKEIIQNIVAEYEQQLERLYQNHRGE